MNEYPKYLHEEAETVAFDGLMLCDNWTAPEYVSIAQATLLHVVKRLRGFATERFNVFGPHDARGAALWDAAAFVDEHLLADPLIRKLAFDAAEMADRAADAREGE